jgi:hypothetical protein
LRGCALNAHQENERCYMTSGPRPRSVVICKADKETDPELRLDHKGHLSARGDASAQVAKELFARRLCAEQQRRLRARQVVCNAPRSCAVWTQFDGLVLCASPTSSSPAVAPRAPRISASIGSDREGVCILACPEVPFFSGRPRVPICSAVENNGMQ